jgi:hypothetical protein
MNSHRDIPADGLTYKIVAGAEVARNFLLAAAVAAR